MTSVHAPDTANDSVHLVVLLLVRHPELSRVIIKPRSAAIALFFAVRGRVTTAGQLRFRSTLADHLGALHAIEGAADPEVVVRVRPDKDITFVEIERDAASLARDEIALIVSIVAEAFGDRLMVNPPADDAAEEEYAVREEAVGPALDAVRRGTHRKGLVGFRDDRRVLVYFGK